MAALVSRLLHCRRDAHPPPVPRGQASLLGTIVLLRLGDFYETFDADECAAGDADQVLGKTIGDEPARASPAVLGQWWFYEPA